MGNLGWLKVHPNCTCVTAAPNDRAEWFSTGHNEDGHRVGASLPTVLTGRVGTFLQGPSSLPRGCSLHPDGPGPPGGATWFWGAVCPLELPMRSGEAYSHWPHPAPSPAQPSPPAMACPESSPCTNPTPCFQGPALRGLLKSPHCSFDPGGSEALHSTGKLGCKVDGWLGWKAWESLPPGPPNPVLKKKEKKEIGKKII